MSATLPNVPPKNPPESTVKKSPTPCHNTTWTKLVQDKTASTMHAATGKAHLACCRAAQTHMHTTTSLELLRSSSSPQTWNISQHHHAGFTAARERKTGASCTVCMTQTWDMVLPQTCIASVCQHTHARAGSNLHMSTHVTLQSSNSSKRPPKLVPLCLKHQGFNSQTSRRHNIVAASNGHVRLADQYPCSCWCADQVGCGM